MKLNLENSKLNKIKRANTDWWINEKAIVGENGKTYIVYYTDMGEIHIKEIDNKCSRVESRDFCLCRLNGAYADEHNSPSICILQSGKIIVAYTNHAKDCCVHYRITERPYDISSFGAVQTLFYDGHATYVQLFENTSKNEVWIFTRVNQISWEFRVSRDGGRTFEAPRTIIKSDKGGLYYANIRRQLVCDKSAVRERFFFAIYGHPLSSGDHCIRAAIIDANGNLCDLDERPMGPNLFSNDDLFDIDSLSVVYDSPEETTVRMLAVAPTVPLRVGLATFHPSDDREGVYKVATYREGDWQLSEPIASSGEFLSEKTMVDGSNSYVGGFEFYYGVGDAGFHQSPVHQNCSGYHTETDALFLSRKREDGNYVLESYVTFDCGKTYQLEQTIRVVTGNCKIWRPIVPIFAQDNMPVYWHEGYYSSYAGGWHCDVCMYTEYDD